MNLKLELRGGANERQPQILRSPPPNLPQRAKSALWGPRPGAFGAPFVQDDTGEVAGPGVRARECPKTADQSTCSLFCMRAIGECSGIAGRLRAR
jgi:hypothetical protein